MLPTLDPTPYPDINEALAELEWRIRAALGEQFFGLYLYGSLATGDFNPRTSDIDLVVVTREELPPIILPALAAVHTAFIRGDSPWAGRVEVAYLPRAALNHRWPGEARYPQLEKDRPLSLDPLEIGWPFQRLSLREYGIPIAGPPPKDLVDPVDLADLRRSVAAVTGDWQRVLREDPTWIPWAREAFSFVVLTLCRCLYSLEVGGVASKPQAGRWAQERLTPRWSALIERALAQDPVEASDEELEEMVALLHYVTREATSAQGRLE